jgi:DNA-binding LacI/PurR family transcriptional regulator
MTMVGEQPRLAIRASHAARSMTIGVVNLDPAPQAKASALTGLQRAVEDADCFVTVVSLPVLTPELLLRALGHLRHLAVDGVLVLAPQGRAVDLLARLTFEIPLVVIAAEPNDALSVVSADHYSGAAAATRHLLDLGHRTVFHIAGPTDRRDARLRLTGWRDTLMAAGAEIPLPLAGDWTADVGYRLGRRLVARSDVTAIFAANDRMALGVLRALFEAGKRVPQDVSVVGFDGIADGEFFSPPLTTVRQDYGEVARRGLRLLRSHMHAPGSGVTHETIPAELVLRASTCAAA